MRQRSNVNSVRISNQVVKSAVAKERVAYTARMAFSEKRTTSEVTIASLVPNSLSPARSALMSRAARTAETSTGPYRGRASRSSGPE